MDIVVAFIVGCLSGGGLVWLAWRKKERKEEGALQRICNELERKDRANSTRV